jgi:hypothetical protein
MAIDNQAAVLHLALLSHNSSLQCHLLEKILKKAIIVAMIRIVTAGMMGNIWDLSVLH